MSSKVRVLVYSKREDKEGNLLPYLSLYLQPGAPTPKLQSLHVGSLLGSNTRLEEYKYGKQSYLTVFGLHKCVYNCLD